MFYSVYSFYKKVMINKIWLFDKFLLQKTFYVKLNVDFLQNDDN